jgi:hypothetical protein
MTTADEIVVSGFSHGAQVDSDVDELLDEDDVVDAQTTSNKIHPIMIRPMCRQRRGRSFLGRG